ncbi:MAG: putative DNA binding domain-containing protein [Bacteroides sp.]|uniref:AlbA family DNA-binding domain-containing protein n=1 Tax=Bacteroides thetaiotaomicron TaxID=818 RepID=UPI001F43AF1D|nr:RNA-binding domain-containing protein [Bacteroides thetaiotaomicron]MCE9138434.1 putative DNA binding domain-containing protein [Bacteroides thetaiotaomicron]MDU8954789.1 putative DNA binding domain-containing protein [Bacteroides sp.]
MTAEEAKNIIAKGEGPNIEFKSCQNEIGTSVYETVCSFLNRSGGYIFIGVDDDKEILGVNKNNLESMKKNFVHIINHPAVFSPKAYVTPEDIEIDGKVIIIIRVEESQYVHRFKHQYFDRNNEADTNVTDNPSLVASLFSRKDTLSYENWIVPMLELGDLDNATFDYCRKLVIARNDTHAWIKLSNEELLKSCGLTAKDPVTGKIGIKMAALLLFGKDDSIASFLPAYRFEAIYRNKTYDRFVLNEVEDSTRYDDRITIRTNLIKAYDSLMDFVYKHLPEKFYLQDGSTQRGDLRSNIFREIIANLCVHREYASNEAGLFEIFADKVRTCNATKFTSSLRTGSISIDELENYTKNPLLFRVFRELGWGEELGSGSRNIKRFAPLYYSKSTIEILNSDRFVFSMTYRDVIDNAKVSDVNKCEATQTKGVNSCEIDSVVGNNNVNVDELTALSIAHVLVSEFISGVSDRIATRMAEEVAAIYVVGQLTKRELKEQLDLSEEQIKIDLRELTRAKLLEQKGKEKKFMLTEKAQIKISSLYK